MRITFFSSVLNHHQLPFCEAMNACADVEFTFVQMIDLTEERRTMGFTAIQAPYVVNAKKDREKAYRLCMDSDVVIAGVIEQDWVNARAAQGKLTFAYKERFCKEPGTKLRPGFWKTGYRDYFRFRNKNLYMLCASAYTAADTDMIFPRPGKKFKWGYFPQVNTYRETQLLLNAKTPNSILWVGRFIELKHPETCITVAKTLKRKGIPFTFDLVGLGDMQETLQRQIRENQLETHVRLLGQMPPEQVREQMRRSEIFLFTSDSREGWGAVLNEAMSEGCACIASRQAGSTGFLIQDGENGFSYDCRDLETLTAHVERLLTDQQQLHRIQKNAVHTIGTQWNAQVAAERFVAFCRAAEKQENLPVFTSGPMSQA